MMMKFRFYISPYFLNKFYLLRDIQFINKKYNLGDSLLDVGCGSKPYRNLFKNVTEYAGIDFKEYSINKDFSTKKPDYFFTDDYTKLSLLPFEDQSFNSAAAFQVLEHHPNPQKFISEMLRIVKSGGFVLLTVPFLGGIHEEPHDYQRFTKYGLIELFKPYKCEIIEIKEQGGIFSTISMLLNEFLNDFASKNKTTFILSAIIYLPFLVNQYLCLLLDKIFKSNKIFMNYLILIKKT
jgi:SAM-dependent methyltransferase